MWRYAGVGLERAYVVYFKYSTKTLVSVICESQNLESGIENKTAHRDLKQTRLLRRNLRSITPSQHPSPVCRFKNG